MPKKLQINAIPQGKVKLNSTSDGAGCCFAQCLSPGWGMQLAAGPGSPTAGLGAANACGDCHPGSTWSPGGQRLVGVRDFHQFSLKKSPRPSSNTPPHDGSLQLNLTQPCCCGQWFRGCQKGGGGRRSLTPQAGGIWGSGAAGRSGPVSTSLARWAGAGAGASKGAGAPSPVREFGRGISDPQGAEGGRDGGWQQGWSCPFALLPGREMEPQDVSAACANTTLAERSSCLLSRAHRKISFPEHRLI